MNRTHDLTIALDTTLDRIGAGDGTAAIADLCDALRDCRAGCEPETWVQEVIPACRAHPINALVLQDPYTARAYHKPRGYAGDAVMLDYVYTEQPPAGTSPVGVAMFRATTSHPNGASVRGRRDLLAAKIDGTAAAHKNPRILSIACGHLREAQLSAAVAAGTVGEFVALDQDAESLAVVEAEQRGFGTLVVHAPITALIDGQLAFQPFHFVYAAGLLDYLSDRRAALLLEAMARMLAPEGRLLVANFTPDNHGRAYMECFMGWDLICRDEGQMADLARAVDRTILGKPDIYRDTFNNIVYLELVAA